jgi:hypothetical protein
MCALLLFGILSQERRRLAGRALVRPALDLASLPDFNRGPPTLPSQRRVHGVEGHHTKHHPQDTIFPLQTFQGKFSDSVRRRSDIVHY